MRALAVISVTILSFGLSAKENIPSDLFSSIQSLVRIDEVLQHSVNQCHKTPATLSAEDALKSNPDYFGGITPTSPKWKEIVKIHREYTIKSCNYFNPKEVAIAYTKSMLDGYTLEQALDLEEHLKSDLGRKLTEQSLKASSQMQTMLVNQLASYGVELNKWYISRIQEVVSRPARPHGG
jgi:hypothetical protein